METRDRILQVAKNCFARYGFHGTSVDRIIRGAGISKGSLYWHFPGKFDIYRTVMEAQARELCSFFEPARALPGEDPPGFIIRRGGEQLEMFSADPDLNCLWKSLHIEAMRGNLEFQELDRRIWTGSIENLFLEFREFFPETSTGEEPIPPREVLESLGACFEGIVLQMGIVRDLEDSKKLWRFSVHRVIQSR